MKGSSPECETCGKPMAKIIVAFEDDGSVMTAYECPEHQTLADLQTESIEELQAQGVSVIGDVIKWQER